MESNQCNGFKQKLQNFERVKLQSPQSSYLDQWSLAFPLQLVVKIHILLTRDLHGSFNLDEADLVCRLHLRLMKQGGVIQFGKLSLVESCANLVDSTSIWEEGEKKQFGSLIDSHDNFSQVMKSYGSWLRKRRELRVCQKR